MRHLLEVDDLTPDELARVLDLAEVAGPPPVLAGRGVGLIFEKPSTRTRSSMEMATAALGGHPVAIRGDEVGLDSRESVEDVCRTLAQYHACVGARVTAHRTLERMAALDAVPVVNLLSEISHPLQAVADLLTLRQWWGGLEGRSLAWVGDGNNVGRSLLLACAMAGVDVRLATPAGYPPDAVAVDGARTYGVDVTVTDDPSAAVEGADAVATDVWVSMGDEDQAAARADAFAGYQVDPALMARAAPGAAFLHCLPAHRGLEVSAEVIDGPSSLVWRQAANRMHSARGLLWWLVAP
ncbi:MAG: ornithine carbamoyltransferase [Acidimicrobiales bacterium]